MPRSSETSQSGQRFVLVREVLSRSRLLSLLCPEPLAYGSMPIRRFSIKRTGGRVRPISGPRSLSKTFCPTRSQHHVVRTNSPHHQPPNSIGRSGPCLGPATSVRELVCPPCGIVAYGRGFERNRDLFRYIREYRGIVRSRVVATTLHRSDYTNNYSRCLCPSGYDRHS